MKHMCKWLGNEDGATSVLIVFMMIVLVTLGAFAITSANVNIKFSNKAAAWSEKYYALDATGELYTRDFDYALAAAEAKAAEYIHAASYTKASVLGVSAETQAEAAALWAASATAPSLNDIFALVYMEFAGEALGEMHKSLPLAELHQTESGLQAELNIGSAEDEDYRLCIRLDVADRKSVV